MQRRWASFIAGLAVLAVASASEAQLRPGSGGSSSTSLEQAANNGRVIISATMANPVEIGNGTQGVKVGGDPTIGGFVMGFPPGDSPWNCWAGYSCVLVDRNTNNPILTINPLGASPLLMYQFQPGYRPLKSVFLSAYLLQGDGTNCPSRPTVVTISNMPYPTFICSENNSSRLKFAIPMRTNWDGGVVYFKPYYSQTAADTGSVLLDSAAACRALGTAFNGTYGTEVNIDDAALVGSGAIEGTLSGAITPNGTCAASDWLYGYLDVDATTNPTTAAATLNFIGVEIFWSETSWSH